MHYVVMHEPSHPQSASQRDAESNDYDPLVAKDVTLPPVRVEDTMRAALEAIADARPDATLADVIREAIREYLERHSA
jgi:hypothetical protein